MNTVSVTHGKKRTKAKKFLPLYLMAVPGFLYLFINNYVPIGGLFIAFKKINFGLGIFRSPWTGLSNFSYLFASKDAWIITRNTLLYNLAFIVVNTVVSIVIAIVLNEIRSKRAKRFYQTVILLPYLVSMVIVSYVAQAFLHTSYGLLNKIIQFFGGSPVAWYMDASKWPFILVFVNAWKGVGYTSIIYYAAVIGVDSSYLEAAQIEGAGKIRQIFSVVLPLISPVIITMVLLAVGRIFYSDFGLFYHVPMNNGMLFSTTNTIDTYVYRTLINQNNVGMSAAAGFYQSMVGFVVVLCANLAVRRFSPDNSLF